MKNRRNSGNGRKHYEDARFFRYLQHETERALDRELTIACRSMLLDLYSRCSALSDYRTRKCKYSVALLVTLIFAGLLLGENNIKQMAESLNDCRGRVRKWLDVSKEELPEMPSDSTLLRALHRIDWMDLAAVLSEWSSNNFGLKKGHVAVDGKAVRAALEKVFGKSHSLYILNAFQVDGGYIRFQLNVNEKTNELGEMPTLFSLMDLDGVTITMDAAGTHADIMIIIANGGGHSILPVKGNQSNLETLIAEFIEEMRENSPEKVRIWQDKDNGKLQHGRIENREYVLITEGVEELLKDTRFAGIAHSVGMVIRTRETIQRDETGKRIPQEPTTQILYYITDYGSQLSACEFATYVRGHWAGCEMIHYVLDNEFMEDRSTVRTGNGMQNFSFIRKAALSLLKWIQRYSTETLSIGGVRNMLRNNFGGIRLNTKSARTHNVDTAAA